MKQPSRGGPPRPPFALCVGVTGHRADVLPRDSSDGLRVRIRDVLEQIERSGAALRKANSHLFAPEPTTRRFVSPIADGGTAVLVALILYTPTRHGSSAS